MPAATPTVRRKTPLGSKSSSRGSQVTTVRGRLVGPHPAAQGVPSLRDWTEPADPPTLSAAALLGRARFGSPRAQSASRDPFPAQIPPGRVMNPVSCSVALGRLIFGGTRAKQCRSTLVALRLCTLAVSAQPSGRVDYAEVKIKQQPVGQMVGIGETAIFKVVMEDDSDPRPIDRQSRIYDPMFQWVKNGSKLEGATTTILTIRNAQPSDAGVYYLAINWSHDRATSAIVTLAVVASAPPAIAAHPTGGAFLQGR